MFGRRAIGAVASVCAIAGLALSTGCAAHVYNLDEHPSSGDARPQYPYALDVAVDELPGLESQLVRNSVFTKVKVYDGTEDSDLYIKGEIQGEFSDSGAANFLTFFPGGALLLPSIRGIRWTYDATAKVEVVDTHSGEVVGTYTAKSSHELVHRASVPGSLFSTLVVIPAVIRAGLNTKVRPQYRKMLETDSYDELWTEVIRQITADGEKFAQLAAAAKERTKQELYASYAAQMYATPMVSLPPSRGRIPQLEPGQLYSKRVAVVVGINDYSIWPNLTGARSDAQRMAARLREMGFDEVIEVYDQDASRKRLLSVLGHELSNAVDENSLAFIYFAGHGQTETLPSGAKRGYLIPVDGEVDDVFATAISMDTLRHLSSRMTAKHVFYAIDACYSGLALVRGISIPRAGNDYLDKVTSMRAVQIVTAGSEGEQAVEIGGQGLFTTYLLRGLDGEADLDGDGAVTASELGTWVKPQVTNASHSRQTPQFGIIEGSGDVVFVAPH